MNTNFTNFFIYAAKEPQNTGGGNSRHEALIIAEQFSQRYALRSEGAQQRVSESETRRVNHAIITQFSRNNHPITLRAMRYVAVLLMVFVVGIGNAWATDTELFSTSFSSWSDQSICSDTDHNPQTVGGMTFYSKVSSNKTKPVSVEDGVMTWFANNMNTDGYYLGIPITGINDGTITVTVTWVSVSNKKPSLSYQVKDGATTFSTSLGGSNSNAQCGTNGCTETSFTIDNLTNANKSAYVYLGRGGSNCTQITAITITTPASSGGGEDPDPDPSATPSITAQPSTAYAQYLKDAAATALSVTATKEGDGTLTYQWYSNTKESNTSGTVLANCTTSTYTPSTAAEGKLYYYCAVTNTEEGKSATTVKSDVSGMVRVVAAPTYLIENRMATSGEWDSYIVSTNAHISNLKTLQAAEGKTLIKSGKESASGGRTPGITSNSSATLVESDYIYIQFTIESGYELTLSEISVPVFKIASGNGNYVARISDASNSIESDVLTLSKDGTGNPFNEYDFSSSQKLSGTVTLKLFAYGWSDGYRMESPVYIDGTVTEAAAPTGYTITKSATNGSIATSVSSTAVTSAEESDQVDIVATPNTGYTFTSWDIYKTGESSTKVTPNASTASTYFTMPAYDVTVGATFTAINYTVTHSAATNGSYTIKVGDAEATDDNTTANYGQTIVLAATPDKGYGLSGWTVMNGETPVSVTNNTFTMPAGNVTVSAEFEEVECPTSGTVFGWAKKTGLSDSNFSQGTYTYTSAAPGDYLTSVTGGTVELYVNDDSKIRIRNSELNFNGGDSYIHVTSACAFQEGDEINVSSSDNTGNLKITLSSTAPGKDGAKEVGAITQGTPFIILVNGDNADLDLVGETEFYIWRSSGPTNVGTLTITRPLKYAVTYSSEKGEAPSNASAASVTLAEITGVSGWKNTGWKANVATEVGGETVAANTLIENGTKVTVKEATTFTAQWEQLYTITTGSPANGTVEADKSSAVAGETITLTPTPDAGYKLSAWDVYKTDDATTKVTVTNNKFTMPAYGVTISATFVESVVLYDYSEMDNKSFTGETVTEDAKDKDKSKTFGTVGNPQLVVTNAGWDSKGNIINSFIKFFGGTSSMSVVIPTGRKATVTIKYGSYDANGKYLQVNGTNQAKPVANMNDGEGMTTETFANYMRTVELTNQTGTLVLTANASGNNLYIAYVDVTLTGYASYGITYHLNDGAWDGDAGAATYTYGTGIATLATNVARDYHDFAGWFGNEGLTGDAIMSIANDATGAKELWAKWTPKSYTLTWSWNGGACSATVGDDYTAGGSVAYGATLVYPKASTMSKDGAAFAGWSSTPATMPAEALTITAQWAPEHAITYTETKGATNANPATYVEGVGVASFEPLADVADFHFTGWSPASIGTEATTDQTITAQWVAVYNVTFSAGEGSGTVPTTFQKWSGASFNLPGQGEMVAPEGKTFVGWKVNGEGEIRAANYEYTMTAAAVEFVAQWKVVTLLINYDGENYSLNTTDFQTGVSLQNEIAASGYPKNAKFGNTCSGVTSIDNLNKAIIYHTKTNATKVTISAYNNYTGGSTANLYYSVVAEGVTSTPSVTTKTMNKGAATTDYEVEMTGRSTLYIMVANAELRICQVSVEENGTANKVAPEVGYSVNLNKQRPYLPAEATTFEGITYRGAANYKPVNGQVQISTCGTDYYSFTIPEGQTRQLQLTTSNTNKYTVSKTLGDAENQYQPKANNETKNWNLTAGTWYINPQGSNVNITTIAFDETPALYTVAFDADGGSSVESQEVFETEKAVKPTNPTKSGYDFAGWYNGDDEYDFDAAVTEDVNLTAHWTTHIYNDATLKSLKYGELSIALEDGVYEYNVELPYYTEGVPALTAVTNSKDAKTPVITNAAALDENNQATSTASVTSEDETVTNLYQVHFTKVVLYEWQEVSGSINWDFTKAATAQIQLSGSSTIKKDEEAVMANIPGTINNASFNSQALKFKGEYIYRGDDGTNYPSCASTIKFKTTVPGVVTVRYADNGGNNRCLSINGHYGPTSSSKTDYKTYSVCVPAGEVVLTGYKDGAEDKYMRFFEIDFTAAEDLDPAEAEESTLGGYEREVTQGRYGTICLPNGGVMVGATIFKVAHMTYQNDKPYKVFFDEVINGVMEAGMPYIFMPKEDVTRIGVYYTDNANATPADDGVNGLHGTLEQMNGTQLQGKYIFSNNSIFMSENPNNWLNANRAYIVLSEVPDYITPVAPGCRRVSMGVNGTNTATGFENIEALDKPMKLMINGQIFILRGEKMFDTTGRLVK